MPDHLLQEDGTSRIEIEGETNHLILESSTGNIDVTSSVTRKRLLTTGVGK